MRIALLLLGVVLSGCLGGPAPPSLPPSADAPAAPDVADPAVSVEVAALRKTYTWNPANLTFENALQRYLLVADGNASVGVSWRTSLGAYSDQEHCLLLAAYEPSADTGVVAAQWAYKFAYEAHVEAMGEARTFEVIPYESSLASGSTASAGWNLTRGQSITLLVGGRSHAYLDWPIIGSNGQASPPVFQLLANVTGPAHLERLPDAPIRCGVGAEQARSAVQATALGLGVTVAGALTMETHEGSALLVQPAQGLGTPQEGSATFHGERLPLGPRIARTAAKAGTVGLAFDLWTDPVSTTPAWLIADADLPFLLWRSDGA